LRIVMNCPFSTLNAMMMSSAMVDSHGYSALGRE
jgi:hypothetical protein